MDMHSQPAAIRVQMRKILSSEPFVRSRRMQRFLEFIVEEALAGRADQLGEYGIGMAVFDRGPDFEPALDPIVRNDARRLRLKLLEYYRQEHLRPADCVLIDVPKGGYVPVFLPMSSRDDDGIPPRALHPRLAVLPFEVLPATPESAMYGRTLGMSLTANLSNLEGLEAIAHDYLRDQPIRQAASELRLSHVIHGSIFRSRDWCRVTINLIHVPAGTQLWAHEFDFQIGEMLAAQSEIAASVLREVTARLGLRYSRPNYLALAA